VERGVTFPLQLRSPVVSLYSLGLPPLYAAGRPINQPPFSVFFPLPPPSDLGVDVIPSPPFRLETGKRIDLVSTPSPALRRRSARWRSSKIPESKPLPIYPPLFPYLIRVMIHSLFSAGFLTRFHIATRPIVGLGPFGVPLPFL